MLTEMSLFDIRVLIPCLHKLFMTDKRKSKERARAKWIKSSSVSALLRAAGWGHWSKRDHFIRWGSWICVMCCNTPVLFSQHRAKWDRIAFVTNSALNYLILTFFNYFGRRLHFYLCHTYLFSLYNERAMNMRQGISGFRSEKSVREIMRD